jgi:hypothetical protein
MMMIVNIATITTSTTTTSNTTSTSTNNIQSKKHTLSVKPCWQSGSTTKVDAKPKRRM